MPSCLKLFSILCAFIKASSSLRKSCDTQLLLEGQSTRDDFALQRCTIGCILLVPFRLLPLSTATSVAVLQFCPLIKAATRNFNMLLTLVATVDKSSLKTLCLKFLAVSKITYYCAHYIKDYIVSIAVHMYSEIYYIQHCIMKSSAQTVVTNQAL